jgi:hypothetical protein|tara:strand:+ start:260 stop:460 length:201 start_codon:yes stop_codon:yes gene_type:complete
MAQFNAGVRTSVAKSATAEILGGIPHHIQYLCLKEKLLYRCQMEDITLALLWMTTLSIVGEKIVKE